MTLGPGWLARSIFSYVLLYSFSFWGVGEGLAELETFFLAFASRRGWVPRSL